MLLLLITLEQTSLVYPPFGHTMGIHRGTPSYLALLTGIKLVVSRTEGIWAVKFPFLDNPKTFADDDELTVFAVNSGNDQIIYNIGFTGPGMYGYSGVRDSALWNPCGITGDLSGNVFVVDRNNNRVVKLLFDGEKLLYKKSIGKFGILEGYFNDPVQVSETDEGEIFVTDRLNNRVQVFDTTGKYLREIKGLVRPTGVFARSSKDRFYRLKKDYLYVIDNGKQRINLLTTYGTPIRSVEYTEIGLDSARFEYIATDFYGQVYITDSKNHCIHIFDPELNYLTSFGHKGKGDGEFLYPRGITIWRRFGQVFVLDSWSVQYFWVGVDGWLRDIRPSRFKPGNGTTIYYFTTQPCRARINIFGKDGKLVKRLFWSHYLKPGKHYIVWDGTDRHGKYVPPGEYTIEIKLTPLYSSRRFLKKILKGVVECIQ